MALTAGVGHALGIAATAPSWRAGDRIAVAASSGAETLAAVHGAAARFDLQIELVESCEPAAVTRALTDRTRLVVVPHVEPDTGCVLPLPDVAAALAGSDAWLAVDASLSAGAIPIDAVGRGVIAPRRGPRSGDRWLLGPEGSGALRLRDGELAQRARRRRLARSTVLGLARSVGWLEMYVGLEWALSGAASGRPTGGCPGRERRRRVADAGTGRRQWSASGWLAGRPRKRLTSSTHRSRHWSRPSPDADAIRAHRSPGSTPRPSWSASPAQLPSSPATRRHAAAPASLTVR
jgi:hypothetical protein